MPRPARPIPTVLSETAFSTREAQRWGVTRAQLLGQSYRKVHPKVYSPSDHVPTSWDLARIVAQECPDAVLSQIWAALMWNMPIPARFLRGVIPYFEQTRSGEIPPYMRGELEIPTFSYGDSRRKKTHQIAEWRHHSVEPQDCVEILPGDGTGRPAGTVDQLANVEKLFPRSSYPLWSNPLKIMSRERTFLDLGTVLNRYELVAVGDFLVRTPRQRYEGRSTPYSTLKRLRETRERYPRTDGSTNTRWALDKIRVGADSPQETRCRLLLLEAGFPEPLLNSRILLAGGVEIPDRDLVFPRQKIVVEYQGAHHSFEQQAERDHRYASLLHRNGWEVVHIHRDDIPDVGWCSEYPPRLIGPGLSRYGIHRVSFLASPYDLYPSEKNWPLVRKVREAFRRQAARHGTPAGPPHLA